MATYSITTDHYLHGRVLATLLRIMELTNPGVESDDEASRIDHLNDLVARPEVAEDLIALLVVLTNVFEMSDLEMWSLVEAPAPILRAGTFIEMIGEALDDITQLTHR